MWHADADEPSAIPSGISRLKGDNAMLCRAGVHANIYMVGPVRALRASSYNTLPLTIPKQNPGGIMPIY